MLIDFHSHILPGMDHGCEDITMSLQQLQMAKSVGVDVIVATSHFSPYLENIASFANRRREAYKAIKNAIPEDMPKLLPAAEVLLCPGLDRTHDIESLCVDRTGTILIEMPMTVWENELLFTLERLKQNNSLKVIIAHVDRYPHKELAKIKDMSLLMQINASAICKWSQRIGMIKLAKNQHVVALGSDNHGIGSGYKQFAKAVHMLGKTAELLMERSVKFLPIDFFGGEQ